MTDYKIGAHILESLTTGMYKNSRTIFREYIQNACDAIDSAVKQGLITAKEAEILINIDSEARSITIEDNGTGIPAEEFVRVMGNVADSDKRHDKNRGFRGIGRLCGMAYCESVVFTAKCAGEGVVSRLTCNAKVLRELLNERNSGINHYSAAEVLNEINEFSSEETRDIDAHYFRVELQGINKESGDLLKIYDEDEKNDSVKHYLECNAPLRYGTGFPEFDTQIHEHAESLGFRISEYKICLNGDELFKAYTREFKTSKGPDINFDLMFEDFRDKDGKLIAWAWVALSCFDGVIKKEYPIRGIRFRKGNIQVGDASTLQRFFKESRGNDYFIGEIFCVSDELVPNARRDYFNETPYTKAFEAQLRSFCLNLYYLYKGGSDLNSSYRHAREAEDLIDDLKHRLKKGYFSDNESREDAEAQLSQAQEELQQHKSKFTSTAAKSEIMTRIAEHVTNNHHKDTYITQGGGGG